MKKIILMCLLIMPIIGCEQDPSVFVNNQTLIGKFHADTNISAFLGIPFAEPPLDDLRWHKPIPFEPRNSIRKTQQFAPACMQKMGILEWYRDLAEIFVNNRNVVPDLSINEDCLYLNIWTPALNNTANLPVMVYIHGGSNDSGWAFEPNYHGHALAQKDVVVVSIAYRLGGFGFLSHPDIENSDALANFGLWDQVAGLQWIKKNINQFGGNPNMVTAFGESAGAQDILALMFAAPAKGLFHQAILQSNAGFGLPEETDGTGHVKSSIDNEQARGIALAKALSENDAPLPLDALRKVPATKILDTYQKTFPNYYHSPAVDGQLINTSTWVDIQKTNLASMKVIIGSNADEYYANTPEDVSKEMIQDTAKILYKSDSASALEAVIDESDTRNALDRLYSAEGMLCPSQTLAERITEDQGKSWVYYFNRVRDGKAAMHPMIRAYHGAELPYVFNTHDSWMNTSALDIEITNILTDYWTNFAKTGDPNAQGIPNWSMFDKNEKLVQSFGNTIQTIPSTEPILCKLFSNRVSQ